MARFSVPSASPPSTPGESPPISPPNGPNAFAVPSSHGTPTTASNEGSKTPPTPQHATRAGRNTFHVPSSHDTPTGGSPPTSAPMPGAFDNESPTQSPTRRKRSASPSPEAPMPRRRLFDFRRPRPTGAGESAALFDDPPGASSSSSSSDDSESPPGHEPPTHAPPSPSNSSDSDLSAQELWYPLVGHQPERNAGRLSVPGARNLTLLQERPGRLPTHTARSPTSPGFEWGDGGAWWPAERDGESVVREIFTPTGFKVISGEMAEATAKFMAQENLVNLLDFDGFGAEQRDVRQEVRYEFCTQGTLNRLLLSRRPAGPVTGPERPILRRNYHASFVPTPRDVFLGLPEDLIWHVLLSLLQATSWLHHRRQPVVHCGINPANIFFSARPPRDERRLVRRYGLVKLGGFGNAVVLPCEGDPDLTDAEDVRDRCTMFTRFIQPEYAETGFEAPEMLGMLGEDGIVDELVVPGTCSDLFSVGATCFAMMTGKTMWDVLLERQLVAQAAEGPRRRDRGFLHEKWRFHLWEERMKLLKPLLQGWESVDDMLPDFYSEEVRGIVAGLVALDPEERGESAIVLDDAEHAFAQRCGAAGEVALREMHEIWKEATKGRDDQKVKDALRDFEDVFGPRLGRVVRKNVTRRLAPLEP